MKGKILGFGLYQGGKTTQRQTKGFFRERPEYIFRNRIYKHYSEAKWGLQFL